MTVLGVWESPLDAVEPDEEVLLKCSSTDAIRRCQLLIPFRPVPSLS